MKQITCTLSMLVILFFGCSKSDDTTSTATTKTPTELLTSSKWITTALTSSAPINYTGNGTLITNLYAASPSCSKDDSFLFQTGGVLVLNNEATKCSSSDPQTKNLVWQFQNNQQEIMIDGNLYTILELSATTFTIKDKTAQSTGGVSHFNTITFNH